MVTLKVNGQTYTYDGDTEIPLLWIIRDELGLTGTKFGCGKGLCGACTVHLDGVAVRSCEVPVADVADRAVVTIEGLDPDGNHPVQRAWRETSAPQCGYCHAGQIIRRRLCLRSRPSRRTRTS
jgi:isoquinoline 1-oxidoreductase subunit alpha